ncbi:PX domain-containing protein/PXA domain-containing protein/Nexin_C domain-containing protein [Cephalotus follicularis]|uniref:PX domain-containing protein/PXA domain-containing protein/Nexin_C domain-containing protein n=1 Tax=Cephalotus follicularis TaxID=3775 RepID=A0A1Q3B8X3_CEPFO|nr:PX domain-containing protein/PXA domain-containing protein/Nexin_C domain-containing protein [Cephalotus follicularis]
MSTQKQHVSIKDLMEEAKKRIVVLVICVVGLSYIMSLTSSSVWVNLPAAASLIILLRYFSLDFDMRRKSAAYNSKPSSSTTLSQKNPLEYPNIVEQSDWKRKVNSPVVEDAIDHFTRHLISEWVTDLWYSRLTPDREGPEELVRILNGVLGEISTRVKNINLIDLLTRDLINLFCTHLELFRVSQAKLEKQQSGLLTIEHRDVEIRRILTVENKLHPALFSAKAEHKVLQTLMDGLISFTFRPEDLQCSFFRYIVRELLACAVIRPVLNLASPRFINERIESLAMSMTKANRGANTAQEASPSKLNGSSRISSDHFSRFLDPSVTGVELVQLKNDKSKTASVTAPTDVLNGTNPSKDPLLSIDTQSSRSWSSLPHNSQTSDEKGIQRQRSVGEWGDILDQISRRKTQALAPENIENMWAKGRNYKKRQGENGVIEQVPQQPSAGKSVAVDHSKAISKHSEKNSIAKPPDSRSVKPGFTQKGVVQNSFTLSDQKIPKFSLVTSYQDEDEQNLMRLEDVESGSTSSYTSEDEETDSATGLGSPGTKVWDGRSNRNLAVSHIHHPLENPIGHIRKKTGRGHPQYQLLPRTQPGRKRSRCSRQKLPVWQEVERTSFLSGDGQDILSSLKGNGKVDDASDDSETEIFDRLQSGATASSSAHLISIAESRSLSVKSSFMVDSFFKLRCEVLGANIVKSGSRTFAVYSISVTDVNNNSWSIKRRFRHFEELHRRLKEFSEYNLHLPPKHFLSTGLDVHVIRERCKLLDQYLKKLLQLPTISGSIDVWDFLSVDSQTYIFSNSFSIVETLSVDLDDKPSEMSNQVKDGAGPVDGPLSSRREHLGSDSKESTLKLKQNLVADGLTSNARDMSHSLMKNPGNDRKKVEDSSCDPGMREQNNSSSIRGSGKIVKGRENDSLEGTAELLIDATTTDPSLPTEWVPPNLSIPILDLVDVIFQLQDGGWIRRKAFWVAKQILHLGMGDAFDDWLIEKIQLLRKGSVVASGIKRVEQILWPDGIFLTKHPKRRPPPNSASQSFPNGQQPTEISSPRLSEEQLQEADRRAKFVYELMIDNAPAAIVGLVGRKEYEQCAKDLYFFLQSSVCLKQLAYDLLELLILSAFPELDYVFKQLNEEKHKFGEY